jgi:hypothetical protein
MTSDKPVMRREILKNLLSLLPVNLAVLIAKASLE